MIHDVSRPALQGRKALVAGIANDYLNHFNEVLLLIENLPTLLPEMLDELLEWKPVTYREYFAKSLLPGSAAALEIYEGLDDSFRRDFESIIDGVNAMAIASIDVIRAHRGPDGEVDPSRVSDFCENASCAIRVSWLFIQLTLPRMVLISPLWASVRNGCASFQAGMVLVE